MTRVVFSKVMWVGRATVFMVGLAVVLALLFGVATTALAGTGVGATFNLGKMNTVDRLSQLVGSTAGAMLKVDNNGTGTALDLQVEPGTPPMKVNSQARVDNLHAAFADDALTSSYTNNADKLDNKSSEEFALSAHAHSGSDITSGAVAQAYIDATVTRDDEVMPIVRANDGANSGVDADTLDSMDSSEFAPRAVEQWHQVGATNEPGFQNGWTNEGTFTSSTTAFYKDPWGVVHLKGLVKNGTVGSAIFALPCGYGTSERQIHTTLSFNNVARVDIVPAECGDGRHSASVVPVTGSNAWISLDGITFRAAGS